MYGPGTGIGPALRKARLARRKTIEEASRDTRIRAEYLQALEREAFTSLRGDVYVRGFLRSYSSYLGLNPDKVVGVYVRATGRKPESPEPPRPASSNRRPLKSLYRRPNWTLAVGLALIVLAGAGAAGLLSQGGSVPPAGSPPATPGAALAGTDGVTVRLHALQPVQAVVYVDGDKVFAGQMRQGGERFFAGSNLVRVVLARGRTVDLTVNGVDVPMPGDHNQRFSATYLPQDYRESPSPSA